MKEETKIQPQSIEAEMAVLGCMLIECEAIENVIPALKSEDFYLSAHKIIYQVICEQYDKNKGIADIVTIGTKMGEYDSTKELGGTAYLTTLVDKVVSATNVEHYAKIVKDKAILRQLLLATRQTTNEIIELGGREDTDDIINRAAQKVIDIVTARITKEKPEHIKSLVMNAVKEIERIAESQTPPGIPSGFADVDRITGGFRDGNVIIIAGRPGVGKTSLSMNIAENVGIKYKKKVLIFSIEMSKEELALKFLSSNAKLSNRRLQTGYVQDRDWPKLTESAGQLSGTSIFIDSSTNTTVMEMKAKAKQLISKEKGLDLIIIDYLQLMSSERRHDTENADLTAISRSLKLMAKDLALPVIALSQLSRDTEKRKGKNTRPKLSDLRGSGAIEQDADVVIMLHRENLNKNIVAEMETNNAETEILIEKNRNGRIGIAKLLFMKEHSRFDTIEKRIEE